MKLVRSKELAKLLGITTACVSRRRALGTLGFRGIKEGGKWFYQFDKNSLVGEERFADRKALVQLVEDLEAVSRRLRKYIGKELRSEARVVRAVIKGKE